ncbi:MAG: DNA-directed RNA polymerase subunit alpha [Candidatus Hydrogenedentes bacterium]|nr:DNA-directed RNA polymerase subunit alpha [Candidatus Hydrogenedentota bacterium]
MNEKDFTIPKIYHIEEGADNYYARVVAEPFERGYGTTIGNSLRRVLLASLDGSAVTAIRFEDVPHEFSAIPGVFEDTTDVVLNLKRCRIRLNEGESIIFTFVHKGEGEVTAEDLFKEQDIDVFNPDMVIFTAVNKDTEVTMEIKVARGRGYKTAEEFEFGHAPLGTIYLDANFSPVTKVNFQIQDARVGKMTDYDRLLLDVWTDGSIAPDDAVRRAASLLIQHFDIFSKTLDTEEPDLDEVVEENSEMMRLYAKPVEELELSARSANCLKAAKIDDVGELLSFTESEMMQFQNFGKKSLDEIKAILETLGLTLGMRSATAEDPEEIDSSDVNNEDTESSADEANDADGTAEDMN